MLQLSAIYGKVRKKLFFFLILSTAVHFFKVESIISDIMANGILREPCVARSALCFEISEP